MICTIVSFFINKTSQWSLILAKSRQDAHHCIIFPHKNDTMVRQHAEIHKYVTHIISIFILLYQTSYISREMWGKHAEKEYVKIK